MNLKRLYLNMSSLHAVVASLAGAAAGFFLTSRIEQDFSGGLNSINLLLAHSSSSFAHILETWGRTGTDLYFRVLRIDFFLAFFLALLFATATAHYAKRKSPDFSPNRTDYIFLALPFIGMVLDWAENSMHILIINNGILSDLTVKTVFSLTLSKFAVQAACLGRLFYNYRIFRQKKYSSAA